MRRKTGKKTQPKRDEPAVDSPLLQLHSVLGELDAAIYEVRRSLDRVLARGTTDAPDKPLPLQELNSLREHLRRSRGRHEDKGLRRSIMDIASTSAHQDHEQESGDPNSPQIGVAPTGPLKVDFD